MQPENKKGLEALLKGLEKMTFNPRTLELNFPKQSAGKLSLSARAFIESAFDCEQLTAYHLTRRDWVENEFLIDFFWSCTEEERTEILVFLTIFIHEYTHRVDFLISPFGLQYQINTMLEYWQLQKFIPQILDLPETMDRAKYLVDFDQSTLDDTSANDQLRIMWEELKPIVKTFHAWGDVSIGDVDKKYVQVGWGGGMDQVIYAFGSRLMEPITVAGHFGTFRPADAVDLWYLRPLTIFETKAVANSLLFILDLLGDKGPQECQRYFQAVYLNRAKSTSADYFFLLDAGAQIYKINDFATLLAMQDLVVLRSVLLTLSGICWYALQAPPVVENKRFGVSNPIFRLWLVFNYVSGVIQKTITLKDNATTVIMSTLLDSADEWITAKFPVYQNLKAINADCEAAINTIIGLNEAKTWNPAVKAHFTYILNVMKPHFTNRLSTYNSLMGMPQDGNPFSGCDTDADWEVVIDDYEAHEDVLSWFGIRKNLFFTNVKIPNMVTKLDDHFSAYLTVSMCNCGFMGQEWISRFFTTRTFTCPQCGKVEVIDRDDTNFINFSNEE